MDFPKKYYHSREIIFIILFLIIVILLLHQLYRINIKLEDINSSYDQAIKQNENSNRVIDSLANEVFIFKTNQERYEVAIDIFKDKNPAAHKQLEYILYNKTE
jgi:hypothetical protein